ncbi:MAG TPA: hypothetical protein VKR06_06845 [Ktedonosporobacter sp.]|nr:hypothetical protein [Ktedonosporobacter sp.]
MQIVPGHPTIFTYNLRNCNTTIVAWEALAYAGYRRQSIRMMSKIWLLSGIADASSPVLRLTGDDGLAR